MTSKWTIISQIITLLYLQVRYSGCADRITSISKAQTQLLIFIMLRGVSDWRRRLHNEELNDLYCSPNIVRMIKSRRMRWAGHVVRMGEESVCIGCWWGKRREEDHWGDLVVDGSIILECFSRRWEVGIWTGLGWPMIERVGGRL